MTKWFWVPLAFPLVLALYYREPLVPFLATISLTVLVGAGLERLGSERDVGLREGFLVVALTWAVFALIEAAPFGLAGPFENYATFPVLAKLFVTFLLWMGRIEIVPVLVSFTAAYWQS